MLLAAENPAAFSGRLTAKPSGKFCSPIPMARFRALSKVAVGDLPTAPNPTPTANPSGMLCTVTAITNSRILFHCALALTS